jgi:hypothetical protein
MIAFSSEIVSRLLEAIAPRPMPEASSEDGRVNVHAAVSRASSVYEKLRNAIDYKDEHLVRKAAIERIVKRRSLFDDDARSVALHLIRELIAAKYLPNQSLPESLVDEVAPVIAKWFVVRDQKLGGSRHQEWVLSLIAAELEELLGDRGQARAMAQFLFERIGDRIRLKDDAMEDTPRRLQVYIACHRVLFKADNEMIAYRLIRFYFSAWMRPDEWSAHAHDVAVRMLGVQTEVERQISHSLGQKFLAAVKPWGVALLFLRESFEEKPALAEGLGELTPALKQQITRVAERRYQSSRSRLKRGTWRSIIYLFMSKMLLALAIELPFERFLYQQIHIPSLAVNVLFPPVLMWLVGLFIRVPGKENTDRVIRAVEELLSLEGPQGREIKVPKERSAFGKIGFGLTYFLTFCLTFGGVVYLLHLLQFTIVSTGIFLFFLCVVSFFAYRLRLGAREYVVLREKDSVKAVIVDLFMLPILRAGQYLSIQVSRINVLVLFFDFIIETPFKTMLNVLEELFAYLKEKKEELQ